MQNRCDGSLILTQEELLRLVKMALRKLGIASVKKQILFYER